MKFIQETPMLSKEESENVLKEIMRKPSEKNIKRQKFLLEILERITE